MKKFDTNEAKDFVLARPSSKGVHTLRKIGTLLEKFDNPQDKIRVIHVAGTNGKGSVTKMLARVLGEKCKVGTFTSPYIREINEAIAINGIEISDEDFADIVNRLKDYILDLEKENLFVSYFETLTAIMYIYFYEKNIDLAIVETGLGGLLDSTNIIKKPLASVITTISMDHMNILGNSLEEIAYQKAGIIKPGSKVFLYPQEDKVYQVFEKKANECHCQIQTYKKEEVKIKRSDQEANIFDFRNYKDVSLGLIGNHQIYNASLALMVLDYFKEEFKLEDEEIKKYIEKAENIGRLSTISLSPRVIVDGSHNREAIDALIKSIEGFTYNKLIIGFSVLKDKEYSYVIDSLSHVADQLIITTIDNTRAFKLEELRSLVEEKFPKPIAIEDTIKAYEYSKKIAGEKDLVIWCGSLYLISEFVNYEERLKK